MVVWLKGQMKCLPVIDRCKVVVGMNVVLGMKVARGKDIVVVRKDNDMDMDVGNKWTLVVMVGQQY